ncbi:Mobile element protein [Candidatus Enterovibrio escicola]|uniref:Mobile element protein n=1 Tax=Candidatus Enterovibrio escicola TaxID=1927127 RepID=A0A2A5T5M5_9GAMM|nr:Mobile element protein [Candidatus Enterovibrio escacola]
MLTPHNINIQFWFTEKMFNLIEVLQVKYFNDLVEQSHQKVKDNMYQCLGWK